MREEVTDQIEQLVARRFVRREGSARAQDPIANHDDTLRRHVARELARRERVHLVREPERASGGDALAEIVEVALPRRVSCDAIIAEVDLDVDTNALPWIEFVVA